MKKLPIYAGRQIIIGIASLVVALLPLQYANASSLSTTTLATTGNNTGTNSDIHKAQARTLSDDGRIAVFSSQASNLTDGPHNGMEQVYAYDRITKKIQLVSRNQTGEPGEGGSYMPTISADGRYVIYATTARDVAPGLNTFCAGQPEPCTNIIVHDLITKYTRVVNMDAKGKRLPALDTGVGGQAPIITRDGRYVTFLSRYPFDNPSPDKYRLIVRNLEDKSTRAIELTNTDEQISDSGFWDATINDTGRFLAFSTSERLVSSDYNGQPDVYLYDLWDRQLTFVSSGLYGFGASYSFLPVISTDGNFIAYESTAENITPDDRNKKNDIFLYDRRKTTTTLVSRSTKGVPAANHSFAPDINGDGQYVVYTSYANNLVSNDTATIDVFLYYTNFGVTRLISRASYDGIYGNGHSMAPSISQNGKVISFASQAHNLTNDPLPNNTLFNNLFIDFNPVRHIPYYDQNDMIDLF